MLVLGSMEGVTVGVLKGGVLVMVGPRLGAVVDTVFGNLLGVDMGLSLVGC